MIATRNFPIPALATAMLVAALSALTGCEKFATGEEVQSVDVSENEDGGYGPVRLALTPDMRPSQSTSTPATVTTRPNWTNGTATAPT